MGLVELAHEGTLFLDEIGDLPLTLQAKLLRVLQEREIQRVGALHTIPVNIRLLAATNRDLRAAISAREFRSDLFYRLNVISVVLPPLRERKGDVALLASFFLERARKKMRKPNATISPEAFEALDHYSFPGNMRELENVIDRMVVLCEGDRVELSDVPLDIREACGWPSLPRSTSAERASVEYRDAKDAFEREYLLQVIEQAHGNISEAARISGLSRRHFYEKLDKLGIKADR
jgi:transcriptional regulator with GAF, ATPase, and Fis domain